MAEPEDRPTRVRVLASPALIQAGLERLVRSAGLEVAANGDAHEASVVVRTPDQVRSGHGVDVVVGSGRLSLTVDAPPDRDTWLSIHRLCGVLLDAGAS